MKKKASIPKVPHRFFRWYCRQEKYEELHGDLEEFFYERVQESGVTKARLFYLWDVIRCCQPYAWKTPKSSTNAPMVMLKNYFKVSMRSLMKSPLNAFINIFGLSVAIGICVLTYGFSQWTYRTDQFHENKEEVYLVTFFADRDGNLQQNGRTPRPLGEMLKEDFTSIQKVCRVEDQNVVLKRGEHVFHERLRFVDPEFLEMFTFPLKWGTAESLKEVNSIILSEEMSVKYFGDEYPIGKEILVKFDRHRNKTFTVTGVAEGFPESRSFSFHFLINYENLRVADQDHDFNDWGAFVQATFVQVTHPSDLRTIMAGMEKYKTLQNAAQNSWQVDAFAFEQLATLHKRAGSMRDVISWGSEDNYTSIVFLIIIAAFMLVLACINYINIAIVSAARRLKEIGLRKVIGATRRMVIFQFLAENILITFFALILGLIIGTSLFIPGFEQINNFSMDFKWADPKLLLFLASILFLTGIASGIYPAFYISRLQIVGILKGSVRFGKKNLLTKLFLGFQLILACILIACAALFAQNNVYMANRSWGYHQEEALYAGVPDLSGYEQLREVMAQNPDVLSLSGSSHHLGKSHTTAVVNMPDREYEVDQLAVDASYFETMGIQLKKGRIFKEHFTSDKQAVIVNELLVKNFNLENPIGQLFKIDSSRFVVVGVVNDFHSYSFDSNIKPTIFTLAEPANYRYLSMRVREGSVPETYYFLQDQWEVLFPETPFMGGHQEDVWGNYFRQKQAHTNFVSVIAFIAMCLGALGLYGLVTLNVTGRIKEFSIKKTLGATLKHIAANIFRQYVVLFVVALGIGAPVSYFLSKFVLEFANKYHMPMNYFGVVTAVMLLVGVLLAIVAIQLVRLRKSNPVEGLRVE